MADLIIRELITLDSIPQLRMIRPTSSPIVLVLGKDAISDGWSSFYNWDATSSATESAANNDVIASSVIATGRWLRIKTRVDLLNVRMCQAKQVNTPAVGVGLSAEIPVAWDAPFANANYTFTGLTIEGESLLGCTAAVKKGSKTRTGCTVVLKNALLAALLVNAGVIHISASGDLT